MSDSVVVNLIFLFLSVENQRAQHGQVNDTLHVTMTCFPVVVFESTDKNATSIYEII